MRSNVVDQDRAGSTTVVGACDGSEALCTCRIPQLKLDTFAPRPSADFDDLGGEFYSDCLRGQNTP